MDQSITQQFGRALIYLLEKEGRGAQTRLAREEDIDRGYLNAIIQGRKPGSEKVRVKIADYFHMPYEEMLALGRGLLEGVSGTNLKKDYEGGGQKETDTRFQFHGQLSGVEKVVLGAEKEVSSSSVENISIAEKIQKVIEILETDMENRIKFADLIGIFHDSLMTRKENAGLRLKLKKLEQRIDQLERMSGGGNHNDS